MSLIPRRDDPSVEMEMEINRKVVLTCSKAKIVVSTLMLFTFWSYWYGLSGILVLLSLISGWIGHTHCSSKQMLRFSQCCCESDSALINVLGITKINVVMGVFTVVTSGVATHFAAGRILAFVIVNGVLALILTVVEAKSIRPLKTLVNYVSADPVTVARKATKAYYAQRHQQISPQQQLMLQRRLEQDMLQAGVYPPGTMINPQGQPVQQQQPVQGFYGYPGQPVAQPIPYPGQIPQQQPVMLQPGMQPPPGMVAYYYPQGQQPGVQPTQLGYPPQPAQQADNIPGPTKS